MLATPTIARAYMWRSCKIWLATRLVVSSLMLLAGLDPVRLTIKGALQVAAVVVLSGFADAHRRREWVLIGNLGLSRATFGILCAIPAIAFELAILAASMRG